MSARSNRTHRVSLPWGLLGALFLAFLAECWVLRHSLDLTPPGAMAFRFAAEACRETRHDGLICLGDSLVKQGLAPRVLEERLGRRVVNLACGGASSPLTYFLFKRSLDAGARPHAVLVDFKATQLQSDPRNIERALAEILHPEECLGLARTAHDPAIFARLALSEVLPSVRARSEIREWARAALGSKPGSRREENLVLRRNWTVNRGAGLSERIARAETIAEHWDEKYHTSTEPWFCHPVNAEYLWKFLELAAARGIRVYWLVPPIHPRVQSRRDLLGLDVRFVRLLQRAVERYANLTVIDGRGAGYPARHFVDATHLDVDGAYYYTDDLATVLTQQERSGGPRWVSLPAYHARPIAIPLEDVSGSRIALFGGPNSPSHPAPESASRAKVVGDRLRR